MRIATVIFLLVILSGSVIGQTYIKLIEPYNTDSIKLRKDEVFKLDTSTNKIIVGKNSIKIEENKYKEIDVLPIDVMVGSLVKQIDSLQLLIDVTSLLANNEKVILVYQNDNGIPFVTVKTDTLLMSEITWPIRLIVEGKPTIFVYEEDIISHSDSTKNMGDNGGGDKQPQTSGFFDEFVWWHYLIGIVVLLFIAFLVYVYKPWELILNRRGNPVFKRYNGESFETFANQNGTTREFVFKHNRKALKGYDKMNEAEKKKFKKDFRGELIIRYDSKKQETTKTVEEHSFVPISKNSDVNNIDISRQLNQVQENIINRINSISSSFGSEQKNQQLQKEIEVLKHDRDHYKTTLEKEISDKNKLTSDLMQIKNVKQNIEDEISRYQQSVIFVDYLEPYAKAASAFYNKCQSGYYKALNLFMKIDPSESELISIAAQFISKFSSNVPVKTDFWMAISSEIKDSRTTANAELIRILKQLPNNEEKNKEFKRVLLKDVLEKYTGSIILLFEEFSKLSRFISKPSNFSNEFEYVFGPLKTELLSMAKTIDLEINFVPLFENYVKYAAFTKLVNQNVSLPYKHVTNLERDTVLEVVSYGFGTNETKVISA